MEVVEAADTVTARGGLPLAVEAMRALGVSRAIKQQVRIRQRARGRDEVAMLEALVMLLVGGGECLDDLAVLRADQGLCRLLDREVPSPDAARRFLDEFHDEGLIAGARAGGVYPGGECGAARAGAGQRGAAGAGRGAGPQSQGHPRS